jgi:hypothetical protein
VLLVGFRIVADASCNMILWNSSTGCGLYRATHTNS